MITERDWYGKDWKDLRKELIKLCLFHSTSLLQEMEEPTEQLANLTEGFIEQVRDDISSRIALDKSGLWQNGLQLMIHPERLSKELARDGKARERKSKRGKKITVRQVLGSILRQFFENNRRELLAAGKGISSHKVKTWERLDKISREISREQQTSNRCKGEHFAELAEYIRKRPQEKNLPKTVKKIREYFGIFSDDCEEYIEGRDNAIDSLSLAKELLPGVAMTELNKCLQRLSTGEQEHINASFSLGLGKVTNMSLDVFLSNHGLSKKEFAEKQSRIIVILRQCLELALASRQGEWA